MAVVTLRGRRRRKILTIFRDLAQWMDAPILVSIEGSAWVRTLDADRWVGRDLSNL
jgi:hypothetical protein